MRKISTIYLLFIALFATSCASRVETIEPLDLSTGGAIKVNVKSSTSLTKADKVPTPSPDEFHITIASTTASEDGTFPVFFDKQYGEMPLALVLKEGQYSVSAICGANEVFSTTAPTYFASQTAEVKIGQTTDIALSATISSYLLDITYTEEFKKAFTDYSIEAHVGDQRFTFAAMGDQVAYLAAGESKLVLKGTTANGQAYSSVIKEVSSPGREHYMLTLSIRPQGHAFDVTIDTRVEQIGVSGEVDPDLYPDMPQPISGELTFTETNPQLTSEANTQITVGSVVSIENLELTFSEAHITDAGLEANRKYSVAVAEDAAALTAAGVEFASNIIGQRTAVIDFAKLGAKLLSYGNTQTAYPVTIKVTDRIQKTIDHTASIKINPPVFTIAEINQVDCWARSTKIPQTVTATTGSSDQINGSADLSFQLSTDQINWTILPTGADISGLTPNTKYFVRALYRGAIASNVQSFTTEPATQVVNAAMEDWQLGKFTSGTGYDIPFYYPWAAGQEQWWNTSNPRSVRYNVFKSMWNCIPGVLYTYSAHSGNRAAEIRNVRAYGPAGNRPYVRGELVIGQLTSDDPSGSYGAPRYITEGRTFESRPTKLRFWYKYAPYGSTSYVITVRVRSGNTIIAEAEISGGETVSNYTIKEIEIPYSNTELKATSLFIDFASSANDNFETPEKSGDIYPDIWSSGWKGYIGSTLYIDDVELIYEK